MLAKGGFPTKYEIPNFPIAGLFEFDEAPTLEELKLIGDSLASEYDRFRCIPDNSSKRWVEVHVNMDDHVVETTVDTAEEFHAYVEALMMVPLSQTKPLWEFHLIKVSHYISCYPSPMR
jgi:hypothetical protein